MSSRYSRSILTMRFLTLRGDDDIKWKEFNNDMIPLYAILSYTWDAEEVLFTDLYGAKAFGACDRFALVFSGVEFGVVCSSVYSGVVSGVELLDAGDGSVHGGVTTCAVLGAP
jgi:hypothetical protein